MRSLTVSYYLWLLLQALNMYHILLFIRVVYCINQPQLHIQRHSNNHAKPTFSLDVSSWLQEDSEYFTDLF